MRTPVLQNCQFFVASVCGYCGYLILGGSAKELRDEEDQHAIECRATHGSVGVGGIEGLRAEMPISPGHSRFEWNMVAFNPVARWLIEMTKALSLQKRETDLYATHEDFHSIFNEGLTDLYKLSFLLTRDPEKAERCLVTGLEDCLTGNRVFREWACSWAKRAIIQNAIRELKPRSNHSNSPISGATFPDAKQLSTDPGLDFEMDAVLRLEDFERFLLIMSVLEHYSEHDCALLLGCSSRETREGRARALQELTDLSRRDLLQDQPFLQETK